MRPFSSKDPFDQFAFIIDVTPSFIIIEHPFLEWLPVAFALRHLFENLLAIVAPSLQSFLNHFHFDFDLIIRLPLLIAFNRRSFLNLLISYIKIFQTLFFKSFHKFGVLGFWGDRKSVV